MSYAQERSEAERRAPTCQCCHFGEGRPGGAEGPGGRKAEPYNQINFRNPKFIERLKATTIQTSHFGGPKNLFEAIFNDILQYNLLEWTKTNFGGPKKIF